MKLKELLCGFETENLFEDVEISGISYDSRKVKPGDVFVCISGFQTDGHKYAEMAVSNGAVAIIAERELDLPVPVVIVADCRKALAFASDMFYDHPSKKFRLIGVTGTNGKTTTTFLTKYILEEAGYKVGLIGTNKILRFNENAISQQTGLKEGDELLEIDGHKLFSDMDIDVIGVESIDEVVRLCFDEDKIPDISPSHYTNESILPDLKVNARGK